MPFLLNILPNIITKNMRRQNLISALKISKVLLPVPTLLTLPNSQPPLNSNPLPKTNNLPFAKAPAVTLLPLCASSALRRATPSFPAPPHHSRTAAPCLPNPSTAVSLFPSHHNQYAAPGTPKEMPKGNACTHSSKECMSAPSVETNHTSLVLGNVVWDPLPHNNHLNPTSHATPSPSHPIIPHFDFLQNLIHRTSPPWCLHNHEKSFSHIQTPYNTDAFEFFLKKHNLTSSYSFLAHNLDNSFPMGKFPPLFCSMIFPNHPSCLNYANKIHTYLHEVITGIMHSPFCCKEMEDIMKGAFQSSPLIVDIQPQPDGVPNKLHMCRHLLERDKLHPSTNDFIELPNSLPI